MMLAPGVRGAIVARMAQNILVDPEPLLRQIKVPTLLPWDEQDGMIPFSNAADYLRDIKIARIMALPGTGHLLQEDTAGAARCHFAKFHYRTNSQPWSRGPWI
jgi:pimeloyl-ACP methyl ester carboxylesterase